MISTSATALGSQPDHREHATIAFIDLAGFSAITDVYGDNLAIAMLELFEALVAAAVEGHAPPVKWIGDEVMLSFPDPTAALAGVGHLIRACRQEARLPLTRTAIHHGPIIRRGADMFGSTVNVAARVAALAEPGQVLATRSVAEAAASKGIATTNLGPTAIRSVQQHLDLFDIHVAPVADVAWIDPVCKMHAPFAPYRRTEPMGPWFCSSACADAFARSPSTYR